MASKEDDTLPLPALSQEFSVDITADEDFIPTSQPLGSGDTKATKISETSTNKSSGEPNPSDVATYSSIDDTLPPEAVIDKDKSSDFIPDTEIKQARVTHVKDEPSCRKKLSVFDSQNTYQAQSSPLWETQMPQIPESPALDTQNFSALNGSPAEAQGPPLPETPVKCQKSIAEIEVNDSAETVDLEGSPIKDIKPEKEAKTEKLSISCSVNSDVGRCEETQIFDNSSVLLLDQPGPSTGDRSENFTNESTQKLYLVKTADGNESALQEQDKLPPSEFSPPAVVAEASRTFLVKDGLADAAQSKQSDIPKGEAGAAVEEPAAVVTRKIDFTLAVTCFVTFDTKTNKVMQKIVTKVNEVTKRQPKSSHFDLLSDNASDKSKRYSTSSSGSVYSDKHGLPFALSKRVSAVSDQTDSSEEDFGARMREKGKALGRTPWSNEYLLPLKLDELVQASIESHLMERPTAASSLREPKGKRSRGVSLVKASVQSSSSEAKSVGDSGVCGVKGEGEPVQNEGDSRGGEGEKQEKTDEGAEEAGRSGEAEECVPVGEGQEESSVVLGEGVAVLARWTDKRYYSGVLCGSPKNERWDVKFDDGTSKAVREDLIMPTDWLKVGALVFVLVDDRYESGQIVDIRRGKEVTYEIELDSKKKRVSATASDLRLTDVMAGIIREKYKPLAATPRGKADIDFENVLSGKRLREQRTPARPMTAPPITGSESKKKSSKKKVEGGRALEAIEETPEARSVGKQVAGLKSEGGHLVEDKVASGDSPSGNEAVAGTPLRGTSKETRGKARPRTLSYEAEDSRPGREKAKNWATVRTPCPGPSGVRAKRKTPTLKEGDSDEPPRKKVEQERPGSKGTRPTRSKAAASSATPETGEKSRRKRKLDGSGEESVSKKQPKRGDARTKGKSRKG